MAGFFEEFSNDLQEAGMENEIDTWTDWKSSPRKLKARIMRIEPSAKIPTQSTEKAAGYDIYACILDPITIKPGETRFIPTGLSIEPPPGYFGAIFARSGLSCKNGIRPANCVGILDEDFMGHVQVVLHNDSTEPYTLYDGERVAQLVFLPYVLIQFEEITDMKTLRASNRLPEGFGSSGRFGTHLNIPAKEFNQRIKDYYERQGGEMQY